MQKKEIKERLKDFEKNDLQKELDDKVLRSARAGDIEKELERREKGHVKRDPIVEIE